MERPFLTAAWRNLIVVNWEVSPDLLVPLVPAGTVLDTFQDRTLVSLVAFQFLETRVRGVAIPGHINFPEVNLRFYVRRELEGETRRGVVFIKELVPRWAIATVARTVYGENYHAVPMASEMSDPHFRYTWRCARQRQHVAVEVGPEHLPLAEGSEEEFVLEHYWGYARHGNLTREYQVTHPRWESRPVLNLDLHSDYSPTYGAEWGRVLQREPRSAMFAVGSAITVQPGRPLST